MNSGDAFLFGIAWGALLLAAAGESLRSLAEARPSLDSLARRLWMLGCVALILHIAAAFQFRHEWSHAAVVADTARQTREVTGLDWGGGVWFNYLFAAIWLVDVAWWSWSPERFRNARVWLITSRAFFLFMWLNAAVVFVRGPMRWFGFAVCVSTIGVRAARWFRRR